jgi:hypothetical protein
MDLVVRKLITYEAALSQASNPDDFSLRYRGVGRGSDGVAERGAGPPPSTEAALEVVERGFGGGHPPDPDFPTERFKR